MTAAKLEEATPTIYPSSIYSRRRYLRHHRSLPRLHNSLNELVVGEVCTGCSLCGDQITTCQDQHAPTNDQFSGVCADYFDIALNQAITGDTCRSCDLCKGGDVCSVYSYTHITESNTGAVSNYTYEPTTEPSASPSVSFEPTYNPTIINTTAGVCPLFTNECRWY